MKQLVENANFIISDIVCDSNAEQFWTSEQYQKGISSMSKHSYEVDPEASLFTTEQIQKIREQAIELNKLGEGDMACFYLQKNK